LGSVGFLFARQTLRIAALSPEDRERLAFLALRPAEPSFYPYVRRQTIPTMPEAEILQHDPASVLLRDRAFAENIGTESTICWKSTTRRTSIARRRRCGSEGHDGGARHETFTGLGKAS
jgi:hypothetical protein